MKAGDLFRCTRSFRHPSHQETAYREGQVYTLIDGWRGLCMVSDHGKHGYFVNYLIENNQFYFEKINGRTPKFTKEVDYYKWLADRG